MITMLSFHMSHSSFRMAISLVEIDLGGKARLFGEPVVEQEDDPEADGPLWQYMVPTEKVYLEMRSHLYHSPGYQEAACQVRQEKMRTNQRGKWMKAKPVLPEATAASGAGARAKMVGMTASPANMAAVVSARLPA